MSACLVSRRLPFLYDPAAAGFIISPRVRLLCAWATDGGTYHRVCEPLGKPGCIPGCIRTATFGREHKGWWNQPTWNTNVRRAGAGPYERAKQMLEAHESSRGEAVRGASCGQEWKQAKWSGCQYNELILDAASWEASLPSTIEAVFFTSQSSPEEQAFARRVHGEYLRYFSLPAATVPLVHFDVTREDPFALVLG